MSAEHQQHLHSMEKYYSIEDYNGEEIKNTFHQSELQNKRQRIPKEQSKLGNLEKLATHGTQDEEKQNKNTTQYIYIYVGHHNTQAKTNNVIRNEPSYKQPEVKTNRI